MRSTFRRAVAGAAAFAVAAAVGPLLSTTAASAAPPGTPPDGPMTMTPSTGDSGTDFVLDPADPQRCPGDTSTGWRWNTFMVTTANDPATLTYGAGGPNNAVGFSAPLFDTGGVPVVSRAPDPVTFNISAIPEMDFAVFGPGTVPDGAYYIGIACTNGGVTDTFWQQTVTVTSPGGGPSGFDYAQGEVPNAPTLESLVPDAGQLTANFTPDGGDTFTAQASTDGFASIAGSETGAASPLTITGLTNGVSYDVRVFASTPAGDGPVSNVLSASPETNGGAVLNLALANVDLAGTPVVDATWDPPAAVPGCTVTGYDVTSSSGTVATPNPDTPADDSSARVSGLVPGSSVTVFVTPTFAAGCVGTQSSASTIVPADVAIYQDIDVTRPIGALVLTQVCGANGVLPAETATPGFPDLAEEPALFSSTVQEPTIPTDGTVAPSTPTLTEDGIDYDPNGPEYPYPTDVNGVPNAEATHCGVDLGVAEFVTAGEASGQYFAAQGAMSQITIVDTRNVDAGWFITGTVTDFVADPTVDDGGGVDAATDTFSGNLLGWTPVATDDTPAFSYERPDGSIFTYDQTTFAGPAIRPNTNVDTGDDTNVDPRTGLQVDGLKNGETLGGAAAGAGLGTAIFDGRIKVLIPVTADAGVYEATLNITAA